MGSFSYTCGVSGLPIRAGHAVRFTVLTENPYDDGVVCYMHDVWFPRTFPLKATYNDYGSIEGVDPNSGGAQLWLEGLKTDLVDRGWGDNTVHDMPTSKDMSFEDFLGALRGGRLLVQRDLSKSKARINKGIPTRKRVERALKKAGLFYEDVSFGGPPQLVASKVKNGMVSVKIANFCPDQNIAVTCLNKAQEFLSEYATVVMASQGHSQKAELLVLPKPGVDFHGYATFGKRAKPLELAQLMIREDVWQELLKQPCKTCWGEKTLVLEQLVSEARELWTDSVHIQNLAASTTMTSELGKIIDLKAILYGKSNSMDAVLANWVGKDLIPYTVGLGTHWRLMVEMFVAGRVSKAEVDAWLVEVAEFVMVHMVLMGVRWWWKPSYSTGDQFGEFDKHATFLKGMAGIAQKLEALDKEAMEDLP